MKRASILIVDDEATFCQLLTRILEEHGFDCINVQSADLAMQTLQNKSFDLLIADILMPDMNGLDLIEIVVAEHPGLAVLVTSGLNELETAIKALEMGAYGYMLKPCSDFDVIVHVTNALRRSELEKLAKTYQESLEAEVRGRTEELEEANTKLRRNIKVLQQKDKLASIGQLAAGIAHEIKTPSGYVTSNLTSLKTYLQRMVDYLNLQKEINKASATPEQKAKLRRFEQENKIDWILDDVDDLLANCLDGISRVKSIIKGLREYSRNEEEEFEKVDLNEVLDNCLLLTNSELKQMQEVGLQALDLPPVLGSRQRLEQVFINLLINAVHATENRGIVKMTFVVSEETVTVKVADNGCGIDKEKIDKIFEAFYTTKGIDLGTGLGLSIVKSIVDEHDGTIEVESQPGEGTTFSVCLPVFTSS